MSDPVHSFCSDPVKLQAFKLMLDPAWDGKKIPSKLSKVDLMRALLDHWHSDDNNVFKTATLAAMSDTSNTPTVEEEDLNLDLNSQTQSQPNLLASSSHSQDPTPESLPNQVQGGCMYSGMRPLAPLLLQEIVLPSGVRGGMQRLAQVPHQAEACNRCSGLGLGKPERGEKPTLQPKGLVHTQREQPLAQAERVQVHENPAEKQRP
jgi:hypothetical protein